MFHHVARSVPGRVLWSYDRDGIALFTALTTRFPDLVALCVMPDHIHLVLPHDDPHNRMRDALAGYAIAVQRRRGLRGPLWADRPAPQPIPDEKHLRRTVRYVHLNPCRSNLVTDPLAWPFSTHRDRCGFAARPVIDVADSPRTFHSWVSSDPTVHVAGSELPAAPTEVVKAERLAHAVAAVWRVGLEALSTRTHARRAFVRAAVHLDLPGTEIRSISGLTPEHHRRLARDAPRPGTRPYDPVLSACVRAAGDPRFHALSDVDHRYERAWARYATRV